MTMHDDEISDLQQQLMISLKFHHRPTIQKIPLEFAITAIIEAWSSCHPEDVPSYCSGTSTAIISQEQAAKAIRESKYFAN